MARLAKTVVLRRVGEIFVFTPESTDIPEWAQEQITNPDAWAEQSEPAEDTRQESDESTSDVDTSEKTPRRSRSKKSDEDTQE